MWLGSAGRGKGGGKNEEAFVVDSPKVLLAKGSKQLWNTFRKTIRMAAGYQVWVCKIVRGSPCVSVFLLLVGKEKGRGRREEGIARVNIYLCIVCFLKQ